MGLVEDTPTGRLILTIMSGFAEFERDMIIERTQEGKAIARQREVFREGDLINSQRSKLNMHYNC